MSIAPSALAIGRRLPNAWDIAAILCVFGVLVGVAQVARGTFAPLTAPEAVVVHLDPAYLPDYAVRTTLRMFAALALLAVAGLAINAALGALARALTGR